MPGADGSGIAGCSAGTSSPRTWSLHPPPRAAFVPKRCLWQLGAASVHPRGFPGPPGRGITACRALGAARPSESWLQMAYSLTNPLEKSLPGAFPSPAHQPVRSESVGELPRRQKLGIEQKERLTGSREKEQGKGAGKGSRERETKRRARLGEIVTRKSDQKPHSCTQAAWGWVKLMGTRALHIICPQPRA